MKIAGKKNINNKHIPLDVEPESLLELLELLDLLSISTIAPPVDEAMPLQTGPIFNT